MTSLTHLGIEGESVLVPNFAAAAHDGAAGVAVADGADVITGCCCRRRLLGDRNGRLLARPKLKIETGEVRVFKRE